MSEQIGIARGARERLAAGLAALQDPGAPESLMGVAEPIAKVMGAMHRIERGDAPASIAVEALQQIREALARLQASTETHPALEVAMENVAQSLSAVHTLAHTSVSPLPADLDMAGKTTPSPALDEPITPDPRTAPTPAPRRSAQPIPKSVREPDVAAVPARNEGNVTQPVRWEDGRAAQPAGRAPITTQPQLAEAAIPLSTPANQGSTQPIPTLKTGAQPRLEEAPKTEPRPVVEQRPAMAPQAPNAAVEVTKLAAVAAAAAVVTEAKAAIAEPKAAVTEPKKTEAKPKVAPKGNSQPAAEKPSNPNATRPKFDVALGTNSNSNFYKGLGPGDLLEAGGLFVATYNIPELGATVDLLVTLPGGFEFTAEGVVAWTRDTPPASQNAHLSPPGFGVRLRNLTTEARGLVHRYARNREPFFYDDL